MHSGYHNRLNVEHFVAANLVCMLLSANSFSCGNGKRVGEFWLYKWWKIAHKLTFIAWLGMAKWAAPRSRITIRV